MKKERKRKIAQNVPVFLNETKFKRAIQVIVKLRQFELVRVEKDK